MENALQKKKKETNRLSPHDDNYSRHNGNYQMYAIRIIHMSEC